MGTSPNRVPIVSVITPTLNQARFLEATLVSVAEQDYSAIEHIVVDGGSTDGTLEILERWGGRWISEADRGQADAINKGVAMANGDICTWLNSDDVYLRPDAVSLVVEQFRSGARIVSGRGTYLDEHGNATGPTEWQPGRLTHTWLRSVDCVLQPATFYDTTLARAFPLDSTMNWAFDWDFFLRISAVARIEPLEVSIAGYRLHGSAKTETGGLARERELARLIRKHHGRSSLEYCLVALALLGRGGQLGKITALPARLIYRLRGRRGPIPL